MRYKTPLLAEAAHNFLPNAHGHLRAIVLNASAQRIPGGWKILSSSTPCVTATKANAGTNGRRDWRAAKPRALEQSAQNWLDEIAVREASVFLLRAVARSAPLCAQRSIRVVGDIAIFVAYDSADVWAHRDLFRLRRTISSPTSSPASLPTLLAPPDSAGAIRFMTGTRCARGYHWWIQRLRWAAHTCDYIRLDHFRGFEQFWEIPANEPTAINGRWVDGPKDELFDRLARLWADCLFSPKISDISRLKCTPCASATTFR